MTANAPQDRPVRKESLVRQVLKVSLDLQDRLEKLEKQVRQDHQVRLDRLENKALKENQALQDLLVRLESVLVNAKQFWYHKTTLLRWMIVMLVLIVLDRFISHSPEIVKIVTSLL
jgi:hypothetical protein